MKFRDLGVAQLSLEISTNCNIRCTFCPIDLRAAPMQYMKLDQVKHVLDQLAEDGSLKLVGFQFLNEPLLHPEIEAILLYAHSVGLRTFVCTNGTILNQPIIDLLARISPTKLKISVQDVNPETFKVIKGTKMDYEEFKRRIANLVRRRLSDENFRSNIEIDIAVPVKRGGRLFRKRSWRERVFGVTFTDQTINDANDTLVNHIKGFLKYLETEAQAPIGWANFNPDLYNTKTWKEGYVPTARVGPGITLELKGFSDWIGIDKKRPVTYGTCSRLEHVVINYEGNFQLCCIDTHGKTAIGNVFDLSIKEILSKPASIAKLLRAPGHELPTEHCRTCMGAPTRRGVMLLNLSNRFRRSYPKFVPEDQRNPVEALVRLRKKEQSAHNDAVVGPIDDMVVDGNKPEGRENDKGAHEDIEEKSQSEVEAKQVDSW